MTINTELFQKVYDQITQHPETHDQGTFQCDTTRCVAGWAVAFHYGVKEDIYTEAPCEDFQDRWVDDDETFLLSATATAAADILGLTDEQAYELFYEMNDAAAVEKRHRYAVKGDEA